MEHERLKERLNALHHELQTDEAVDPEVQELLQQLSEDIDSLLQRTREEDAPVDTSPADDKQTLLDRLLNLTEEFEESHPKLAEAIGNVASALSRIGI